MSEEQNYRMIQCKVNRESYDQLQRICNKLGVSLYTMLQNMAECLVRFTDDRHNLSQELSQAIMLFHNILDWKHQVRLTDIDADPTVTRAIYFIGDKNNPNGEKVVMVDRPICGVSEATENVQIVVEAILECVMPQEYKWLRQVAVELECNSTLETLKSITEMYRDSDDLRELRQMFADSRRMDNGKQADLTKFKRTRSAESYQTSLFNEGLMDPEVYNG